MKLLEKYEFIQGNHSELADIQPNGRAYEIDCKNLISWESHKYLIICVSLYFASAVSCLMVTEKISDNPELNIRIALVASNTISENSIISIGFLAFSLVLFAYTWITPYLYSIFATHLYPSTTGPKKRNESSLRLLFHQKFGISLRAIFPKSLPLPFMVGSKAGFQKLRFHSINLLAIASLIVFPPLISMDINKYRHLIVLGALPSILMIFGFATIYFSFVIFAKQIRRRSIEECQIQMTTNLIEIIYLCDHLANENIIPIESKRFISNKLRDCNKYIESMNEYRSGIGVSQTRITKIANYNQYFVWVFSPQTTSFGDLSSILSAHLYCFITGQYHGLPTEDSEKLVDTKISKLKRVWFSAFIGMPPAAIIATNVLLDRNFFSDNQVLCYASYFAWCYAGFVLFFDGVHEDAVATIKEVGLFLKTFSR